MRAIMLFLVPIILVSPAAAEEPQVSPAPAAVRVSPATPISVGPGPLADIRDITEAEYNRSYMLAMHQQNSDIAGIALYASMRASDPDMRTLSRKIAEERFEMNDELKKWYQTYANRIMPRPKSDRYSALQMALYYFPGDQFDCAYASVMIDLMRQSKDALDDVKWKTHNPELLQQARVYIKINENEIKALQKWQETGRLK